MDPQHACQLLAELKNMLDAQLLTDIAVRVETGRIFLCHRNVLASISPYFKSMFTNGLRESCQQEVQLCGVEEEAMQLVLDFAYTSRAELTTENVQAVFTAASLFQVEQLLAQAAHFMAAHIDPQNAVGVFVFADAHHHAELRATTLEFILRRFAAVASEAELLTLRKVQLVEILASDDLNVEKEELVYESITAWLQHDRPAREGELEEIMTSCLRLSLLEKSYIQSLPEGSIPNVEFVEGIGDVDTGSEIHQSKPRLGMMATEMVICFQAAHKHTGKKRTLVCLEPISGEMFRLCKLPGDLRDVGIAVTPENEIYVAGGYRPGASEASVDHRAESECWQYDHSSNQWQPRAALLCARISSQLVHCAGSLYALGGHVYEGDGRNALKSVEQYDGGEGSWQAVAPMPLPLEFHSAVAYKNKIYVLEGEVFLSYSPTGDTWSFLPPMSAPRFQSEMAVLGDWLYVVGGVMMDGQRVLNVERYCPGRQVWECRPALPLDVTSNPYVRVVVLAGELHTFARQTQLLQDELVFRTYRRHSLYQHHEADGTWVEVYTVPDRLWDLGRSFECVVGKLYPHCLHKVL
uniref:kelch repeat and BTB domain-containing protein 8 isoform X2 n=1 Tax=Myxine glutinosa TaxID=7769 RepID=UPI00358FAF81